MIKPSYFDILVEISENLVKELLILRKLRVRAGVYNKYTYLISVLYNKSSYLNMLTYKLKFG